MMKYLKSHLNQVITFFFLIILLNGAVYRKRADRKQIEDHLVFTLKPEVPGIGVPAYLCVCHTCKSPVVAVVTGCILKTEARFVAFSHPPLSAGIQQVIVAEFVHAVVMSNVPHNAETAVSNIQRKY